MTKRSSISPAPRDTDGLLPIDRTKPIIIARDRTSKYNPNECKNTKANERRLKQMGRHKGVDWSKVPEVIQPSEYPLYMQHLDED